MEEGILRCLEDNAIDSLIAEAGGFFNFIFGMS